jgi:hypothetical protein
MPYKQNTNLNITTSSSIGVDSKGKTFSRSSKTTSETITRRKLTTGELSGGLLTTIGQIQMIGITIFVLIVSQPLNDFDKGDLEDFIPNYQINNQYVAVEDPLNHYNYQQFGEGVVDRLWAWVEPFEQLGIGIKGFWDSTIDFISGQPLSNSTLGDFAEEFGGERQYQLYLISRESGYNARVFDAMTTLERDWIVDNGVDTTGEQALFDFSRFKLIYNDELNLFGGGIKWWFTEPSVIDIAIQEGYGT